jgi:hypothetical protein
MLLENLIKIIETRDKDNLKIQNDRFTEIKDETQENKARILSIKDNLENISNPRKNLPSISNNLRNFIKLSENKQ